VPELRDSFGRRITNCRISVTDRCNLRCVYCMPAEPTWLPRAEILTFEEIVRFARVCLSLGIDEFRVTGGEPTARAELPTLVGMLAALPGLRDLAMTTNGILLEKLAQPLRDAGLRRLNVSLDTLREERFVHIARREGFGRVKAGLEAARRAGFAPVKLNMVVMRGVNDDEVVDFAALARTEPTQVRFIEFMPLDGDHRWSRDQVVPAQEILDRIRSRFPLEPSDGPLSDPARTWRFRDGRGDIGIIASVSEPFCFACDRVRITADGRLRTCLFSHWETDLRGMMRGGASDAQLAEAIRGAVAKKEAGHGINDPGFVQPVRAMYSIGG
jgi:cyclic pyranopterin phosphate synthase